MEPTPGASNHPEGNLQPNAEVRQAMLATMATLSEKNTQLNNGLLVDIGNSNNLDTRGQIFRSPLSVPGENPGETRYTYLVVTPDGFKALEIKEKAEWYETGLGNRIRFDKMMGTREGTGSHSVDLAASSITKDRITFKAGEGVEVIDDSGFPKGDNPDTKYVDISPELIPQIVELNKRKAEEEMAKADQDKTHTKESSEETVAKAQQVQDLFK